MVRFGLQIPWFSWPGSPGADRQVLRDVARAAEDAGCSSLWVMDHFFQLPQIGDASLEMHEAYTTLGYLAGVTENITLGTMVTGVTYRHPGVLVKQVTTLDVLSGGRAWLAIGAAWFDREHEGLGIPFPPVAERFERLEEALRIAKQMWSEDDGPFHGTHYRLEETICSPQPVRRPPILVGGGGERKTLRIVAAHADACNIPGDPDTLRHKFGVLRKHCDELGRDYEKIERTRLGTYLPGADALAEAKELVGAGAQHLIYNMPAVHTLEPIRLLADEVIRPLSDG